MAAGGGANTRETSTCTAKTMDVGYFFAPGNRHAIPRNLTSTTLACLSRTSYESVGFMIFESTVGRRKISVFLARANMELMLADTRR